MREGGEERTGADGGRSYGRPFAWWGPVWETLRARSLPELIGDGVMPASWAALLWALLARRASVVVVAEPRGAGKTTVLGALLDCYPATTRRLYLRGCYEPFAFLEDPAVEPKHAVLVINEISGHLPVYLWGPGVGRALAAAGRGFAVAATAHAADVAGFVGSLTGYPLRLRPEVVGGAFDLVVVLEGERRGGSPRVAGIWGLAVAGSRGIEAEPLAHGTARDISHVLCGTGWAKAGEGGRFSVSSEEVAGRAVFLDRLVAGQAGQAGEAGGGGSVAVAEALAGWRWRAGTGR